jgi:hypothetical protein
MHGHFSPRISMNPEISQHFKELFMCLEKNQKRKY